MRLISLALEDFRTTKRDAEKRKVRGKVSRASVYDESRGKMRMKPILYLYLLYQNR